ncbi:hypothetical protein Pmani_035544 [Petrolisthes manimaculis]|uniref:Uncharacterized protein n=1 Tax=Petrolisthes manimaculis TaxID=1843537 RepID=A0AAE1TNL2_9EUCA|nr:hypothetical protein Pmani_035544 [Petrolisthes manimaculis]
MEETGERRKVGRWRRLGNGGNPDLTAPTRKDTPGDPSHSTPRVFTSRHWGLGTVWERGVVEKEREEEFGWKGGVGGLGWGE